MTEENQAVNQMTNLVAVGAGLMVLNEVMKPAKKKSTSMPAFKMNRMKFIPHNNNKASYVGFKR